MLNAYVLKIQLEDPDGILPEKNFKEMVIPIVEILNHLKRSFDKEDVTVSFLPPNPEVSQFGWLVSIVVMISVGKERGSHLVKLYRSIADFLINLTPLLDYEACIDELQLP